MSNLIPNYKKIFPLPTTISTFNKLDTRLWLESANVCWEREHKKALKAFVSIPCLPAEFKATFRLLQFVLLGKIQIGFDAELVYLISSQTLLMVAYLSLKPWLDIRKTPIACLAFMPFFFMHKAMAFITMPGHLLIGIGTIQLLLCLLAGAISESNSKRIFTQG